MPSEWRTLLNAVPWVHPRWFADALRLSVIVGARSEPADFKGPELFTAAAGRQVLHTTQARELFEQLFVANGDFAMLYSRDLPMRPCVNTNPRRLVVHDGRIPGESCEDEDPHDPVAERTLLLDLCSAEVRARRYQGPYTLKEAVAKFGRGILVSSAFVISRSSAVSTKHRLVHNASGPGRSSVNGGIEDDYVVKLDYSRMFQERLPWCGVEEPGWTSFACAWQTSARRIAVLASGRLTSRCWAFAQTWGQPPCCPSLTAKV